MALATPSLTLEAGDRRLTPRWAAVPNAASHALQWKLSSVTDWEAPTGVNTVRSAMSGTAITGLANGTQYDVRVRAEVGEDATTRADSAWSSVVQGTPRGTDVCDRTPAVRDAILAAVIGISDCLRLTATQLAAITALNLSNKSLASLEAGDFNGLTGLTSLDLSSNSLGSLPEGIFAPLGALTTLNLTGNGGAPFAPEVRTARSTQTVAQGAKVELAGLVIGPWGGNVTWAWTQVTGASSTTPVTEGGVTLTGATSPTASFTTPASNGTLYFHAHRHAGIRHWQWCRRQRRGAGDGDGERRREHQQCTHSRESDSRPGGDCRHEVQLRLPGQHLRRCGCRRHPELQRGAGGRQQSALLAHVQRYPAQLLGHGPRNLQLPDPGAGDGDGSQWRDR